MALFLIHTVPYVLILSQFHLYKLDLILDTKELQSFCVRHTGSTVCSVDSVAFLKKVCCQIGTILSGDPSD